MLMGQTGEQISIQSALKVVPKVICRNICLLLPLSIGHYLLIVFFALLQGSSFSGPKVTVTNDTGAAGIIH